MRILDFIRLFNEGTATFIYYEIKELVALNHEVTVSCINRINEEKFPFDPTVIIPLNPLLKKINYALSRWDLRMNFRNPRFRKAFNDLVNNFQPDVIHCHFGFDALFVLDNFTNQKIPILISFHGYDASSLLEKKIYRRRWQEFLQQPNVFPVFVSRFMKKNFQNYGLPVDRSFLLYCGTDLSFFQRRKEPPSHDPFIFLQVSSFREKKGHEYTLKAFAKLLAERPQPKIQLILAGNGPLLQPIKELCKSLGLNNYVEFPGFVTPAEARSLMEQAHAFVHHSIISPITGDMEGIPTVIMEAMAMELPVLSTRHSGIPELVEDGVNGYLVEERDVEHYARRMKDILSWGLAPQNREKVAAQFERKQHARLLTRYYQEAIEKINS